MASIQKNTLCEIQVITLNEDDQLKKTEVNKHPKFDKNLEHFEYVMINA